MMAHRQKQFCVLHQRLVASGGFEVGVEVDALAWTTATRMDGGRFIHTHTHGMLLRCVSTVGTKKVRVCEAH